MGEVDVLEIYVMYARSIAAGSVTIVRSVIAELESDLVNQGTSAIGVALGVTFPAVGCLGKKVFPCEAMHDS